MGGKLYVDLGDGMINQNLDWTESGWQQRRRMVSMRARRALTMSRALENWFREREEREGLEGRVTF